MFYVYVLKSLKNGDVYIGFCKDLRNRFALHNKGRVFATRAYVPWSLIYYEAYKDKRDATRREKQLKLHRAKLDLKNQLKYSLDAEKV